MKVSFENVVVLCRDGLNFAGKFLTRLSQRDARSRNMAKKSCLLYKTNIIHFAVCVSSDNAQRTSKRCKFRHQ